MKNKLSRFAVPYVVWMAIFVVAPIVIMVIYAFSDGDGGANDYIATVHEATVQYIDFLINFIKTIE